MTAQISPTAVTYETDYAAWVQAQADLMRSGRFAELDLERVLEEFESLSGSDRDALVSYLTRLYQHLLKWRYQPDKRSTSWVATVKVSRNRIERLLKKNPSFKPWLPEAIRMAYEDARYEAYGETGLPLKTFPIEPPFTWDEARTMDVSLEP